MLLTRWKELPASLGSVTGRPTALNPSEPVGEPGTHGGNEMSLYDIAGEYQSQSIQRPSTRGLIASLFAALRRSHDTAPVECIEDPNEAKHRRREQGYLMDIGI